MGILFLCLFSNSIYFLHGRFILFPVHRKERKRHVLKLSGGQQQRAAIARALASDATAILADEPTGNLDEDTAAKITSIRKQSAHSRDKCVIVVAHSADLAGQADVVFSLKKGVLQVTERAEDLREKKRRKS